MLVSEMPVTAPIALDETYLACTVHALARRHNHREYVAPADEEVVWTMIRPDAVEHTGSSCRPARSEHPSCSCRDADSHALPAPHRHSRRQARWQVVTLGFAVLLAASMPQSWAAGQDGQGHSKVHRRPRKDQSMGRSLADHSSSLPPGFYKRSVDVSPVAAYYLLFLFNPSAMHFRNGIMHVYFAN